MIKPEIENAALNSPEDAGRVLNKFAKAIENEKNPKEKIRLIDDLEDIFGAVRDKFGYEGPIWGFYSKVYFTAINSKYENQNIHFQIDYFKHKAVEYQNAKTPKQAESILRCMKRTFMSYRHDYLERGDYVSSHWLQRAFDEIMMNVFPVNSMENEEKQKGSK